MLGEQHPETLTSMRDLANLYQVQGKYAEAERLLTRALEIRRRIQGEQHPDTTNTLASLGEVRLRQQRYSEAEVLLRSALLTYEKTATDTWPRYRTQRLLGASLVSQNMHAEAESLLLSGYQGLTDWTRRYRPPIG